MLITGANGSVVDEYYIFSDAVENSWDYLGVKDFDVDELCPYRFGPPPTVQWGNVIALGEVLQDVRTHFGKPTNVNSGYRPAWYNAKVGGAVNSQHILAAAADIDVIGVSPDAVFEYLDAHRRWSQRCGLGRYKTFTHVDVRHFATPTETPARWDNRS